MSTLITEAAQQVDQASKVQSSQGVLVQTYCNSVLSQPSVDLSGTPTLVKSQNDINQGIKKAKIHANDYLNVIQPLIITNITNISNYYGLHNAVSATLPPGSSAKEWISTLNLLKDQSIQYQSDTQKVITKLQTLNSNLGDDSATFGEIVSSLNSTVNGDHGILVSIDGELGTLQSNIDGAIAGIALSGLAIMGGVFVTAVGAIANFVTAGTSNLLVAGGVALIVAGIGGEVASALTLKSLSDQKNKLLLQQSSLTSEVNLALGMKSGYSSLNAQAQSAMQAATQMGSAWNYLSSDLGNLINDLEKGINSADMIRTLWLNAANGVVKSVLADTDMIKGQMTGMTLQVAPKDQLIGDFALGLANQYKVAA